MIYFESSPEAIVEDFLAHYGKKGMKWGVRNQAKPELTGLVKKPITRKLANGDEITLSSNPPGIIIKARAKLSKNFPKQYNNSAFLTIKDKQGKNIGTASFWKKGKDELYLNWLAIDKSKRGQGYATEVLKASFEYGKANGIKRMVLEVPANAPDARHIYEKMGFKVTRELTTSKNDPFWGGLTEMEYKFN